MMYLVGLIVAFIWGIGPAFPYSWWYLHGITPGDMLFVLYLVYVLFQGNTSRELITAVGRLGRWVVAAIWTLAIWMLLSSLINAIQWDISYLNLVHETRIIYYMILMAFVALWVYKYDYAPLVAAFVGGILTAGVLRYLEARALSISIMGFVVLRESNVIGNLLGVGTFMVALLILKKWYRLSALFLIALPIISIYTYSKGAWLMVGVGLLACLVAYRQSHGARLGGKRSYLPLLAVVILALGVTSFWQVIVKFVIFKLASTVEQGTLLQRLDFIHYTLVMAVQNPFFGVGVENFRRVYATIAPLGATIPENPHSAFLHVLASGGFPALALFMVVFMAPFARLYRVTPFGGSARWLFVGLALATFGISAGVQLNLFTQHFFWVFMGIVIGWQWRMETHQESEQSQHQMLAS